MINNPVEETRTITLTKDEMWALRTMVHSEITKFEGTPSRLYPNKWKLRDIRDKLDDTILTNKNLKHLNR